MKQTNNQILHSVAIAIAMSTMVACSDDSNNPAPQSVNLNFAAKVAGETFTCGGTFSNVGSGLHDYKVLDYRMYINNVHVHDDGTDYPVTMDSSKWQLDNVALLDFEDSSDSTDCNGTPETNTQVLGTIDRSLDLSNVEICFDVGVPFEHNHSDVSTAASPFNLTDMSWPWKVGRKYIKIDGIGDPAGANESYHLHLGAQGDCGTGANGEAAMKECSFPNTFEVCIPNMDMNADVIDVDVARVLEANDISMNLSTTGMGTTSAKPGCQSFVTDEDCVEIFPRLKLDYTDYGNVSGTSSAALEQKLFQKE